VASGVICNSKVLLKGETNLFHGMSISIGKMDCFLPIN